MIVAVGKWIYELPGPWNVGDRIRAECSHDTLQVRRLWQDGETNIIDILYDGPYVGGNHEPAKIVYRDF